MLNKLNHLQQRLLAGSLGAVLILFVITYSQVPAFKPIAIAFMIALIAVAMWEFHQISYAIEQEPAVRLSIWAGVAYALSVAISTQYASMSLLPEITLLASVISFFVYYFRKGESPFLNLATTLFSFFYLAVPLSCMLSITYFFTLNGTQDGRWWITYLILVTKITDTAAFFVGRRYGKQKLAPYISPKKTWEGAMGGLVMAVVVSFLFTSTTKIFGANFHMTIWQSLWLGAGVGLLAEFGDLAESLLKRDGGIKDSNRLPGLGGILDMVDSLVFTAPFVYIFLKAYT